MDVPSTKIYFPEQDKKEILRRIDDSLSTGQLTLGKNGQKFEEEFAKYIGTKYAIAVNSGTSALEISLRALDVAGFSVIVPTNTFFATPAAVIHAGGRVIFADISENLCIDAENIKRNIKKDTRGVIVVHIGGIVIPGIEEIKSICRKFNLFLIEDAAHAHGSSLDGRRAGTFADAAAFSFYPTKVMTSAEGGMITTNEETIYKRSLVFRDQGKAGFYSNIHTEIGYNWRMSEIHASIGLSQLARLDEFIKARIKIAKIYDAGLKEINGIRPLEIPKNVISNYYKYVALLDQGIERSAFKKELKERYKVSLGGEVYELPCHLQPVFKNIIDFKDGEFPKSEDLCKRHICLPMHVRMSEGEAEYVIDSIKKVISI